MSSNPDQEGDYVLSFLSLLFEAKVVFVAVKSNNVQATTQTNRSSFLEGKINVPSNIEELFKKLNSMDYDLLRQYLRSCDAYRTALLLVEDNPTLSFFLMVTAIQAISGKVIGKTEGANFREFILNYLPKSLKDEIEEPALLTLLIKEAYNMRCAYTHGGTALSIGSLSAEQTNRIYIKHYVGKKEVYSPSLRWFERIVRAVLVNFLEQQKTVNTGKKLSKLAMQEAIIYLKQNRILESGRVVFTKDVDLDFKK